MSTSSDQRIDDAEEMVGSTHSTKDDTLNRLFLVEGTNQGGHVPTISFPYIITERNINVASGFCSIVTLPTSKTISSLSYTLSGDGDLYIKTLNL